MLKATKIVSAPFVSVPKNIDNPAKHRYEKTPEATPSDPRAMGRDALLIRCSR
jgi:hypothetical protein